MAFGIDDAIANVSGLLTTAINKIWPDPSDKSKAEALVITAAADAAINQLKAAQAVMLAEAQSADPWTSRARPSFLYVIYFLIMMSVPMSVVYAVNPQIAQALVDGFHKWLAAIPEPYLQLFGIGYLGYGAARSADKMSEMKYGNKR